MNRNATPLTIPCEDKKQSGTLYFSSGRGNYFGIHGSTINGTEWKSGLMYLTVDSLNSCRTFGWSGLKNDMLFLWDIQAC